VWTDESIVGAVHNPVNGEMFAACEGEGATLNGRTLRRDPRAGPSPKRSSHRFHLCVQRSGPIQARMITVILPAVRDIRPAVRRRSTLCAVACGASTPSTRPGCDRGSHSGRGCRPRGRATVNLVEGLADGSSTVVVAARARRSLVELLKRSVAH